MLMKQHNSNPHFTGPLVRICDSVLWFCWLAIWPCKSTHTHIHTRLMTLYPGLPGWAGTRKVKPIWISLKQETVSGSGISWAICKSAPRSRQITMPAPHCSVLQAGCPSCRPTNSVKALKALQKPMPNICLLIWMRQHCHRFAVVLHHSHVQLTGT